MKVLQFRSIMIKKLKNKKSVLFILRCFSKQMSLCECMSISSKNSKLIRKTLLILRIDCTNFNTSYVECSVIVKNMLA